MIFVIKMRYFKYNKLFRTYNVQFIQELHILEFFLHINPGSNYNGLCSKILSEDF